MGLKSSHYESEVVCLLKLLVYKVVHYNDQLSRWFALEYMYIVRKPTHACTQHKHLVKANSYKLFTVCKQISQHANA